MKTARAPARHAPRSNARLAAVQALYQMELSGASVASALDDLREGRLPALETGPLDADADMDLFKRILDGAVDHQAWIDTAIARALSEGWRLERIDSVARAILRAGVVELNAPRDASNAVIIGEYVDIAKAFFDGAEPGFVNAALDACAKSIESAAAGEGDER